MFLVAPPPIKSNFQVWDTCRLEKDRPFTALVVEAEEIIFFVEQYFVFLSLPSADILATLSISFSIQYLISPPSLSCLIFWLNLNMPNIKVKWVWSSYLAVYGESFCRANEIPKGKRQSFMICIFDSRTCWWSLSYRFAPVNLQQPVLLTL